MQFFHLRLKLQDHCAKFGDLFGEFDGTDSDGGRCGARVRPLR